MKLDDNEILKLQEVVQLKSEKIKKLKSRFEPLTNCSYKRFENDIPINLHVKDETELVKILSYLIQDKTSFDKATEISKTNLTFKHQGFIYDKWESDILFLIEKKNLIKLEKELEEDMEIINELVSEDAKKKQKFDKLMEKYKN